MKSRKAMTLVELAVVMFILLAVAGLLVPKCADLFSDSKDATLLATQVELSRLYTVWKAEGGQEGAPSGPGDTSYSRGRGFAGLMLMAKGVPASCRSADGGSPQVTMSDNTQQASNIRIRNAKALMTYSDAVHTGSAPGVAHIQLTPEGVCTITVNSTYYQKGY